jgi:hypothetical protein
MSIVNLTLDYSKQKVVATVNGQKPDNEGNVEVKGDGITSINDKAPNDAGNIVIKGDFIKDTGGDNTINLEIDPSKMKVVQTINGLPPNAVGDIQSPTIGDSIIVHDIGSQTALIEALKMLPDIIMGSAVLGLGAGFSTGQSLSFTVPSKIGCGTLFIQAPPDASFSQIRVIMSPGSINVVLQTFNSNTFHFELDSGQFNVKIAARPHIGLQGCGGATGTQTANYFIEADGIDVDVFQDCNFSSTQLTNGKGYASAVNGATILSAVTKSNMPTFPDANLQRTFQDNSFTKIVLRKGSVDDETTIVHTVGETGYLQVGDRLVFPHSFSTTFPK